MLKNIFTHNKKKLEAIRSDLKSVLIFIQDDTDFPSKISSIKLSEEDVKRLIITLTKQIL